MRPVISWRTRRSGRQGRAMSEVTCLLRVDTTNPSHTWVSLFAGRNPDALGYAGSLCLRTDELAELLTMPSGAAPESTHTPFTVGDRFKVDLDCWSEATARSRDE